METFLNDFPEEAGFRYGIVCSKHPALLVDLIPVPSRFYHRS